jgi:hypothetical protein
LARDGLGEGDGASESRLAGRRRESGAIECFLGVRTLVGLSWLIGWTSTPSSSFFYSICRDFDRQPDLVCRLGQPESRPQTISHPIETNHPLPFLLLREDAPLEGSEPRRLRAGGKGGWEERRRREGKEDVSCLGMKRIDKHR